MQWTRRPCASGSIAGVQLCATAPRGMPDQAVWPDRPIAAKLRSALNETRLTEQPQRTTDRSHACDDDVTAGRPVPAGCLLETIFATKVPDSQVNCPLWGDKDLWRSHVAHRDRYPFGGLWSPSVTNSADELRVSLVQLPAHRRVDRTAIRRPPDSRPVHAGSPRGSRRRRGEKGGLRGCQRSGSVRRAAEGEFSSRELPFQHSRVADALLNGSTVVRLPAWCRKNRVRST